MSWTHEYSMIPVNSNILNSTQAPSKLTLSANQNFNLVQTLVTIINMI